MKQSILFFADRQFPLVGGMEVHADAFISYFQHHPQFPLLDVITKEKSWKNLQNPSIVFFNSGHWIEELEAIRKTFSKASFFYRTGGNEIVKASLSQIASHQDRQRYWVNTLNQCVDTLITNSQYTEERLRLLGITTPFLRIVGGVYAENLYVSKPCINRIPRLFSASRFVPYKNHLLLISVLKRLFLKGYRFHLRLAGDGPLLEKVQEAGAIMKDCIEFLGVLNNQEVCLEMKQADVYVQLSSDYLTEVPGGSYIHAEGMGRSILEAITAGVFIIAGKSGALEEIVTPEKGKLVDTGDTESIYSSLEEVFKIKPARREWSSLYEWKNVFKAYESAFSYRKI